LFTIPCKHMSYDTKLPAAMSLSSNVEIDLRRIGRHTVHLALEIGVYHGVTTNLICDKYLAPGGKMFAVDPLVDGLYIPVETDEAVRKINSTRRLRFTKQFDVFSKNTERNRDKMELLRMTSDQAFPRLHAEHNGQFDLIYIDGDHRAAAVWEDAVHCFELCKIGGYILFDDYEWELGRLDPVMTPKPAIDQFLREYSDKVECLHKQWRVLIRKRSD
jgi:hypothetical protein